MQKISYSKDNILAMLDKIKAAMTTKGELYFKDIIDNGSYISFTCPFHKNHNESHPSCSIVLQKNEDPYFHCFSCSAAGNLIYFVSRIFNVSPEAGEQWICENFGEDYGENNLLPEIELTPKIGQPKVLNESILSQFDYYHPYMWKRNLSKNVVDKFRIGYDNINNAITFPVWDERNNLRFITERSVTSKKFWIPKESDRGSVLYLLNFALQQKVPMIGITEAQIDALTGWGYGFPCCASIGAITEEQVKILNKSGIRIFVLMFDNDEAGEKFANKFNRYIRKDVLTYRIIFPKGKKDINDLTKEEFDTCLNKLGINYRIN